MNIFLSYRRNDSAAMAGRIFDRLASQFGRAAVFMDVDAIPLGTDFRQHIGDAVGRCDVLLALIGDRWISATENGRRRLDDPRDFVRVELETALDRGVPLIPLLIGQAGMPVRTELPASLQDLAYRNAARIDIGRDFHAHVDRLIRCLESLRTPPNGPALSNGPPQENPDRHLTSLEATRGGRITLQVQGSKPMTFDASEDRRVIIGRGQDCDLCVSEPASSRKHAMIIYDLPRGWMLQDLNSRNGVVLNGAVVEKIGLKEGDRIKIGATDILVCEAT